MLSKKLVVAMIIIFPAPALADTPRVSQPPTVAELLAAPETPEEARMVAFQLASCSRRPAKSADPRMVLALWRLEGRLGVPTIARGILGAAWCWETGFSTEPPVGDGGRSHGPFQMMGWFWNWCGHPIGSRSGDFLHPRALKRRTYDVPLAASCFWARVEHHLADGKCPGNVWRAEAMASHGPKYAPQGCKAESLHALELNRWKTLALQAHESVRRITGTL